MTCVWVSLVWRTNEQLSNIENQLLFKGQHDYSWTVFSVFLSANEPEVDNLADRSTSSSRVPRIWSVQQREKNESKRGVQENSREEGERESAHNNAFPFSEWLNGHSNIPRWKKRERKGKKRTMTKKHEKEYNQGKCTKVQDEGSEVASTVMRVKQEGKNITLVSTDVDEGHQPIVFRERHAEQVRRAASLFAFVTVRKEGKLFSLSQEIGHCIVVEYWCGTLAIDLSKS